MSAHTPGPWKCAAASSCLVCDSAELQVASVARREGSGVQAANAALIAAAPELLERLRARVRECPCCGDPDFPTDLMCDECAADIPLIARAEGRS